MTQQLSLITGNEEPSELSAVEQVLVNFYDAFNHADINKMEKNWANNNAIAMDNPLGGIKRGWHEIKPVYERVFNGPAKVYVEYYDFTLHQTADMFYAVGRERGYFKLGNESIELAIRTSRVFERIDTQWRQVHHHGSIDDAELLAHYQQAVFNQ